MEAVKFLKEAKRLCSSFEYCLFCPLYVENAGCMVGTDANGDEEVAQHIVEKWSKEHPKKTRQSELLKMFPNARMTELGSLKICPVDVDKNIECSGENCLNCRKKYWLAEVEG